MKRLIAILLTLLSASFLTGAQNKSRIGNEHAVDIGIYYGYGTGRLSNHAGGFMDINAQRSGLRTRLNLEIEQTQIAFCPAGAVELLYMAALDKTLCLYPLVGVQAEYHNDHYWDSAYDISPEAGIGLEFQFTKGFGYFLQAKYKYGLLGTGSAIMGQTGFVFAFGGKAHVRQTIVASGADLALALRAKDNADDLRRAEEARIQAEKEAADREAARLEAAKKAAEKAAEEAILRASTRQIIFPRSSSFVDNIGRDQIAEAVEILMKYENATVEIQAYADRETESPALDMILSQKRAEAVQTFFIDAGVTEPRIKIECFGSSAKASPSQKLNRVVIVTTK